MPIFKSLIYIGLGVSRSFNDMPMLISGLVFPLEKSISAGGKEYKELFVHAFNFDPSFAPENKTALMIMFESGYSYWEDFSKDRDRYNKEKIALDVISALDRRFPGLSDQVEMWDVATPVTFHRYTGNWQGSGSSLAAGCRPQSCQEEMSARSSVRKIKRAFL